MRKDLKKRLAALNKQDEDSVSDVLSWIRQGLYYDELTEEQKDRYCLYRNTIREVFEEVETFLFDGDLHFKLEENEPPPTKDELSQIIEEVEQRLFMAEEE